MGIKQKLIKLDIGCGASKKEGFIGVDILKFEGVDIVHDLSKFPYPFEENSIDEIWMDNVLEHIENPILVMNEIYRICSNEARITISVPYFRSFYSIIDPTHRNYFGVSWFNYFDPSHVFNQRYKYTDARFSIDRIQFDREWLENCGFWHRMLISYAEKNPSLYESKISHLLPLNSLTFYLTALK
jgi:predicted SAM-dependent methyltransferase